MFANGETFRTCIEISQNISSKLLTEGTFIHPAQGITLYIRAISSTGELADMFLSDARQTSATTIYTARRAFLVKSGNTPKLVMFNGMAQSLRTDGQRLSVTRFDNFTYDIGAMIAAVQGMAPPLLVEVMSARLPGPGISRNTIIAATITGNLPRQGAVEYRFVRARVFRGTRIDRARTQIVTFGIRGAIWLIVVSRIEDLHTACCQNNQAKPNSIPRFHDLTRSRFVSSSRPAPRTNVCDSSPAKPIEAPNFDRPSASRSPSAARHVQQLHARINGIT